MAVTRRYVSAHRISPERAAYTHTYLCAARGGFVMGGRLETPIQPLLLACLRHLKLIYAAAATANRREFMELRESAQIIPSFQVGRALTRFEFKCTFL
jgi:hypothetical protein